MPTQAQSEGLGASRRFSDPLGKEKQAGTWRQALCGRYDIAALAWFKRHKNSGPKLLQQCLVRYVQGFGKTASAVLAEGALAVLHFGDMPLSDAG